jgi:Xaa-Pro aminopeptidase
MPPSFDPDLSRLDSFLDERGLDAYLVDADATDSDQRYLSGYDAPDPYVTLRSDGQTALLVSGLEYARANRTARADAVCRLADYGFRERAEELGRTEARRAVVANFCADFGAEAVAVPDQFPLGAADGLREHEVSVDVDDEDVVTDIRAVKTDAEIEHVERAQRANEAAMAAAETLFADAAIENGLLYHEGDPLTSERVTEEIEVTLLRHGCGLDETIVAAGADAAEPHERGSGPIEADEPIIVDIFPRDKETKYHADMTRTFCRGTPGEAVREFYEATEAALDAALDAIEPGVTGEAVHDAACDVYEERGYPTLRSDESAETGFIHSTGHGVGLDVHELPRLSPGGGDLEPGHVVTVEPGLYDPEVGGVRIEDLVVVTEDGHRNLTDYGREWAL